MRILMDSVCISKLFVVSSLSHLFHLFYFSPPEKKIKGWFGKVFFFFENRLCFLLIKKVFMHLLIYLFCCTLGIWTHAIALTHLCAFAPYQLNYSFEIFS